ncbi:MAG: hypothetical protein HUU35_16605, partial [Armatimonadetes bacterium]|nr:hypothetical protein [Armatimonadota bacterium]
MRACMLRTLLWLAAALPLWAAPEPAENLLRNPGFEAVREGQVAEWMVPSYWSGEASFLETGAHGGKRALRLKAVVKNGREWARTYSGTYPAGAGLRYRLGVWAKGTGSLKLGAIEYIPAKDNQPPYRYVWQPAGTALTAEWREYHFDLPALAPEVLNLAPIFEIEGPGASAELDDALFAVLREPGARLAVEPPYAMVSPGEQLAFRLTASAAGRAWSTGAVR